MRSARTAALGLALLGVAATARAEGDAPPSVRLEHSRGPGAEACPDDRELADAISARLGFDPFRADAERRVRVGFSVDARGLVANLVITLADGSERVRELRSAARDCEELVRSVALAVSVAIDPLGKGRAAAEQAPREPPAATEPAAEAPPAATPPAAAPPAPKAAPRDRATRPEASSGAASHAAVSVFARGAIGELPLPSFGGGAALAWHGSSFLAGASADVSVPTVARAERGGRYRAWLAAASVRACATLSSLGLCALVRGGRLRAEGLDVDVREAGTAWTASAGLGPRFEHALTRDLALAIGVDALVSLARVGLDLDGREVWKSPPMSASLYAGLSERF